MEESADWVVDTYAAMVYRLAVAQMHARSDADDVFQEVFLRYARKTPAFETEEHRKAWLLRVTVNCCRRAQTSPWRKRTEPLTETLPFYDAEDDGGFFELLRLLPGKYRAVIHLFYYEGYSAEEIGGILDRKPATVRSQLARGREYLRRELKGAEDR